MGGIAKDEKGNYLKDSQGNIQYFGIDLSKLEELATAGTGKLVTLTANNTDVKSLLSEQQVGSTKESKERSANIFGKMRVYILYG